MGNDLMRQRRALMGYHPYQVTEEPIGPIIIAEPPVDKLALTFAPMQTGSGTPSPSNVRPIYGHGSATVSIGSEVFTTSFGATYMGGVVDLVTGVLKVDTKIISFGADAGWMAAGNGDKFYATLSDNAFIFESEPQEYSNMYPYSGMISNGSASVRVDKSFYLQWTEQGSYRRIWVYDSSYTLTSFKALLETTPLRVTYPIAEQTYQLTPQAINAIRGQQSVLSPAGRHIEITYWTI